MKAVVLSCLISGMLLTTAGLQAQTTPSTTADKTAKADKAAAKAQAKADKAKAKADKAAADAKAKAAATTTPAPKPAPNPTTQPASPKTPPATTQPANKSGDKVVGTDDKGRTIYEGSRGGRYYLTKNGNKEYIKKKS